MVHGPNADPPAACDPRRDFLCPAQRLFVIILKVNYPDYYLNAVQEAIIRLCSLYS